MSGLLFLTSDDFHIAKGTKGNIMCNNIPGFSLILFYSTQCGHCQSFIPVFKRLPSTVGGCQFGMINVSQNRNCVIMSRDTIAPIKVVPYILLFVNGRPYMRYQGPHAPQEIGRFIVEVADKIKNQEQSTEKNDNIAENPRGTIPAYTIGKPLYGPDDKVCYLEFDGAYGADDNTPGNSNKNRQQLDSRAGMR